LRAEAEDGGGTVVNMGGMAWRWEIAASTLARLEIQIRNGASVATAFIYKIPAGNLNQLTFTHANTVARTYTYPNATGTFVLDTATQTLTNKTLTTPIIGDFSSATHNHQNAAGGGQLIHGLAFSDTGATGAELETLTDDSMADTLHRHSELSASDGSPDQALVVDAIGQVGIGTPSSQGILHVDDGLGSDGTAKGPNENVIFEGANMNVRVVGDDGGNWGVAVTLDQVDLSNGTDFENTWGMIRRTNGDGAGGGDLRFTYGTNVDPAVNSVVIALGTNGDVHIQPVGTADVELEVSNGASQGGGTIHRASSAVHSSRKIKSNIADIPSNRIANAIAAIKALKPVKFKYKKAEVTSVDERGAPRTYILVDDPNAKEREGFIFEDAPENIKGDHEDIVIDKRIFNLELAMKRIVEVLEGNETL